MNKRIKKKKAKLLMQQQSILPKDNYNNNAISEGIIAYENIVVPRNKRIKHKKAKLLRQKQSILPKDNYNNNAISEGIIVYENIAVPRNKRIKKKKAKLLRQKQSILPKDNYNNNAISEGIIVYEKIVVPLLEWLETPTKQFDNPNFKYRAKKSGKIFQSSYDIVSIATAYKDGLLKMLDATIEAHGKENVGFAFAGISQLEIEYIQNVLDYKYHEEELEAASVRLANIITGVNSTFFAYSYESVMGEIW